jgi:hypothetical protein
MYNNFQVVINIPSELPVLNDNFIISVYFASITGGPPNPPISGITGSSTKARWAKLK